MLKGFIDEVKNNKLKVDGIIVSVGEERCEHFFRENIKRDGRSLSKVVSGLAIGKACEKGLIDPEDKIMQFFPEVEITNHKNREHLENVKIKHLLSLTIGHSEPLMMRRDYKKLPEGTDYISYILNSDINHAPGTHFVYTNSATHLLSAIMQKITGVIFDQWVYENLLQYLDMDEPVWERTSQGICFGATGLLLNVNDVHKIGMFLLNRGSYKGKQIVESSWIDTMHEIHILNHDYERFYNPDNTCFKKIAYGYHIWVCGDGSATYPATHYFGDGADGQQLIICPEEQMVIAIMARLKDSKLLEKIICDKLLDFLSSK